MTFYQLRVELANRSNIAKDDAPITSQMVDCGSVLSAIAPWLVVVYLAYLQLFATYGNETQGLQAGDMNMKNKTWFARLGEVLEAMGWKTSRCLGLAVFHAVCAHVIV